MTTSKAIEQGSDNSIKSATASQQDQNIKQLSETGKQLALDLYNDYKKANPNSDDDNSADEVKEFMLGFIGRIEQKTDTILQRPVQDLTSAAANSNVNQALSLLSQSLSDSMKYQFTYPVDIKSLMKKVADYIWTKRTQLISQQMKNDFAKMQNELMAINDLIYKELSNQLKLANEEKHEKEHKQEIKKSIIPKQEAELALELIQEYQAREAVSKLLNIPVDKCEAVAGIMFQELLKTIKNKQGPIDQNFAQCMLFVHELRQQLCDTDDEHPIRKYFNDFTKNLDLAIKDYPGMHETYNLINKIAYLPKHGMTGDILQNLNKKLDNFENKAAVSMVTETLNHMPDDMIGMWKEYSPRPTPKSALSEEKKLKEKEEQEQERSRPTPFDLYSSNTPS